MEQKEEYFSTKQEPHDSTSFSYSSNDDEKLKRFRKQLTELENVLHSLAELYKCGPDFDENLSSLYARRKHDKDQRDFDHDYSGILFFIYGLNQVKAISDIDDLFCGEDFFLSALNSRNPLIQYSQEAVSASESLQESYRDLMKICGEKWKTPYVFTDKYVLDFRKNMAQLENLIKAPVSMNRDAEIKASWHFFWDFYRYLLMLVLDKMRIKQTINNISVNLIKEQQEPFLVHSFPKLVEWLHCMLNLLEKNEADLQNTERNLKEKTEKETHAVMTKITHLSLKEQQDDEQFLEDMRKAIALSLDNSDAEQLDTFGIFATQPQSNINTEKENKLDDKDTPAYN